MPNAAPAPAQTREAIPLIPNYGAIFQTFGDDALADAREINRLGTGLRDRFDLGAEPSKIGRQNRSSYANGLSHHRH